MILNCYVDADLAGDRQHTRSQSGMFIELVGAQGRRWPIAWASRKQPLSAASSGAAELISLAAAMRKDILPLQYILAVLLGRPINVKVFEDNTACLQSIRNGYSPGMRDLTRTLRISIEALHELHVLQPFADEFGFINFEKIESDKQKSDMFTKILQRMQFEQGCFDVGIVDKH